MHKKILNAIANNFKSVN